MTPDERVLVSGVESPDKQSHNWLRGKPSMLAFCTRCWEQVPSDLEVCPHCGAPADNDPRSFEEKLLAALHHPLAQTRARICWVLGQKRHSRAVPHLLDMLNDEDLYVRISALRALGEIGDPSAIPALEEAARSPSMVIRLVAKPALDKVRTAQHPKPRVRSG